MTQVVLPIAYQFDPDLVIVSAGFDAAVNDPLGGKFDSVIKVNFDCNLSDRMEYIVCSHIVFFPRQ